MFVVLMTAARRTMKTLSPDMFSAVIRTSRTRTSWKGFIIEVNVILELHNIDKCFELPFTSEKLAFSRARSDVLHVHEPIAECALVLVATALLTLNYPKRTRPTQSTTAHLPPKSAAAPSSHPSLFIGPFCASLSNRFTAPSSRQFFRASWPSRFCQGKVTPTTTCWSLYKRTLIEGQCVSLSDHSPNHAFFRSSVTFGLCRRSTCLAWPSRPRLGDRSWGGGPHSPPPRHRRRTVPPTPPWQRLAPLPPPPAPSSPAFVSP